MLRTNTLIAALTLILSTAAAEAGVAPAEEKKSSSADGLLTDGLDGLLEGLPGIEPTPPEGSEKPAPGDDLGSKSENPLARIQSSMDTAGSLIASRGKPADTSRAQQQVISDLDELIKQAKQQSSQSQSSQQNQEQQQQASQRSQTQPSQQPGDQKPGQQANKPTRSTQAASQSTARLDKTAAEAAAMRPPGEMMKEVWGRLPQRLREQMLESSSDEFLPEYREEIESYFRELAEKPE